MHLHQGKLGDTGGPQYWLQDIPTHVSGHLQRVKACPVILQTPYGPVETPFVAVEPNHKLVGNKIVKANAQHYRIQKGESKISIGEAIRQWFTLRSNADLEQIEIEISFDKQSRFILVPLQVKFRGVSRPQVLPPVNAPLSFHSKHQSELWKSQIERCKKTDPEAFGWTVGQFKRFVQQRNQTNTRGADERDLLRLAGAFDRLGIKFGPYLNKGYDCPESQFLFLDFPVYPCPLEVKTQSDGFKYQVKNYKHLPRVVVLCLNHDLPHPPQHVDVIEVVALAKHLSA
jgi:hypothetical protein